jgi:predicted RNase H-like HicB family nuclease
MKFHIDCEREADGRWIAEVDNLPGVLAYGQTAQLAMLRAETLALRVLAEQLEAEERAPLEITFTLAEAA